MNERQEAKWEKHHIKGMWRFVLLYGVLGWGGLMFVLNSAFDYFFKPGGLWLIDLLFSIPLYLLTGLGFGILLRFFCESRYKNSKK